MTNQEPGNDKLHQLQLVHIDLVGGGRQVSMFEGINFVRGDITTGKTTFVKLIRALLGKVPRRLAPETDQIRALRATYLLGGEGWEVYRPLVETRDVPVDLSSSDEARSETARLQATGPEGYGDFLLKRLSIPRVSVPKARTDPTAALTPISINDWLGYCIVTGDELDSEVFGHHDSFKDQKRRWVFELAYDLYDVEAAELFAEIRRTELRLEALEREEQILEKFLAGTPFADRAALEAYLAAKQERLDELSDSDADLVREGPPASEVGGLRAQILDLRERYDSAVRSAQLEASQLQDLRDLHKQLKSQSARLTRAIVADEWLVDFDFIVCPRCGSSVRSDRAASPHCYLCLQEEHRGPESREALIKEQERVSYQIGETEELVQQRGTDVQDLLAMQEDLRAELSQLSADLDRRTQAFVSEQASRIRQSAAEYARLQADIRWANEYVAVLDRQADHGQAMALLRARLLELQADVEGHGHSRVNGEEHITVLEQRILQYLEQLHTPLLGELLTVTINRKTYLPEVSGRSFDELSSQGLKTLVNVAHALAHHTVAIDRGLPLPGLLVLDGISANSGREGLEVDRIADMYRLLIEESERYAEALQLIIVDNDLPAEVVESHGDRIVLQLSQSDRLVRTDPRIDPAAPPDGRS